MAERRPRSGRETELLERARRVLPAGVRSASRSPAGEMVVREARGARLWDLSGNEYVDYLLGSGALLLGHAHPKVVAAVSEQLERGAGYLVVNEPALRLAEEIVRAVPCAEQVAFHSSGSESVFFALRLARAHRRRDKILKFEGAFHGMSDYALVSNQWTRTLDDPPAPVPNSAGIPACVTGEVLVAPFNDLEATAAIVERRHDELAAVIVEPMQRTIPPRPGFLPGLRELTRRYDLPLVFDEVVTGFRLAYGGAQERYGVVPDLCALGKSLSAGHPLGVLCGRAEIMGRLDPAHLASGDHVAQTGTFSGNPISAVAALATLAELRREGAYAGLFARGRRLMEELGRMLAAAGIPARVTGEPPAFEVWFTEREIRDFRATLAADEARHARFTELLLERGIVKGHEKFFLSMAHGEEEVERTLEAFAAAVEALGGERRPSYPGTGARPEEQT